jgi:hypothetical protein
VDDIKVPTIRRKYEMIKADDMFDLVEIVDDNMTLFRRTPAPLLDPLGDGWWLQGYNRPYYEEITGHRPPAPAALTHRAETAAPVGPEAGFVRRLSRVLSRSAT